MKQKKAKLFCTTKIWRLINKFVEKEQRYSEKVFLQGASQGASEKSGILWIWERPLGTPLGLVQWKWASSRVEAGTSGFCSWLPGAGSDSDSRVPAEFAQECQVSCSAEEWNSAYISSCSMMTPLFVMCVEPAGFSEMHGGVSAPSCCAFIHRVAFEEVSGHRVLLKCGPGNRPGILYDVLWIGVK